LSSFIPSSIDKCCILQILELSINQFSGIIPKSFGNLTQLKQLYLGLNNLEGQIEEIGNLFGLEMLSIQAIKGLTCQILTSIFNISSLKTIAPVIAYQVVCLMIYVNIFPSLKGFT
ncbi:hypothetical protein Gotur_015633, partial [Gossypium turneri]